MFNFQHNTIEAVLQRGEKLDDLVDKSEGLSMQSKAFYKTVSAFREWEKTLQCLVLFVCCFSGQRQHREASILSTFSLARVCFKSHSQSGLSSGSGSRSGSRSNWYSQRMWS